MTSQPAENASVQASAYCMEETDRLTYILYVLLYGASAVMLMIENYASSWLWLFVFLCLSLVTVLTFFLSKEQKYWISALTLLHGFLVLLLVYLTQGLGCIPLILPIQMNIAKRYGKKAAALLTLAFYLPFTLMLYLTRGYATPYPAAFLFLAGLSAHLLLLTLQDSARFGQINTEKIAELQASKKELHDLNVKLTHYGNELEKITVLRERNRMSKRMHDTLGHVLTAVYVQLEAAELLLEKDPDQALQKIQNAKTLSKEGLESIKQALSLIDEDNILFEERLHDVIAKAEMNLGCKSIAQISMDGLLHASLQEFLLSALREGITNGVRHGGATAFVFRLKTEGSQIHFYLEDNGTGCGKISMGYGLTAMETQAESYGGSLDCYSVQDEGFVLKIDIPSRSETI
jgi:signal transduction histidine kinase